MTDYQTFIVVQEIAFQNASMTKNNALTKTYLNQFNRHVVAFLKEGDYSNSFRQPKENRFENRGNPCPCRERSSILHFTVDFILF